MIVLLCLFAAIVTPVLTLMMLVLSIGNPTRGLEMALAVDEMANAMFRGMAYQTISARTGIGAQKGYKWAVRLQPLIDDIFGQGHCLDAATAFLERNK